MTDETAKIPKVVVTTEDFTYDPVRGAVSQGKTTSYGVPSQPATPVRSVAQGSPAEATPAIPTKTIKVRGGPYVPPGGPTRVYANAYVDGGRHYVEGAMRTETTSDQLYLCASCGQEGTLGLEWLRHAGFEGTVHCPACHAAMDEIPWSRKRRRRDE